MVEIRVYTYRASRIERCELRPLKGTFDPCSIIASRAPIVSDGVTKSYLLVSLTKMDGRVSLSLLFH